MKKASAKIRRKVKIKFCRNLSRMDQQMNAKRANSRSKASKK